MKEIEAYRARIKQAATIDEKKAIATELHRLANTFNEDQKAEYASAMNLLRNDILAQLQEMEPLMQRAEELLNRIESRVPQP